jgi:hypothetical protein
VINDRIAELIDEVQEIRVTNAGAALALAYSSIRIVNQLQLARLVNGMVD